jgi:hypothetical protein
MDTFVFAFPVWSVFKAGEPGILNFGEEPYLPLFSNQEMATKYRDAGTPGANVLPSKNAAELIALLEWIQQRGVHKIAVDPGFGVDRIDSSLISHVLQAIKAQRP